VSRSDVSTELEQALLRGTPLGRRGRKGEATIGIGEDLERVTEVDMVLQVGGRLEGRAFDLDLALARDDKVLASWEPADSGYAAAEKVYSTWD
jgi:hypothetical protein